MKKIISIIISILIILLSVFSFFIKKKNFSVMENRYLQQFPIYNNYELINGKYISNIEEYLSDHFPLRNYFVGLKTKIERIIGKDCINDVYYAKEGYLIEKYSSKNSTEKISNKINDVISNTDISCYIIISPTSVEINSDKLPKYAINDSQLEDINKIYESVNCKSLDIYQDLKAANRIDDVFYKTDHHWTTYGAYTAYLKYADANSFNSKEYKKIEMSKNFYGTLYSKVNDASIKPDRIELYAYENEDYTVNYVNKNIKKDTIYNYKYLKEKDMYQLFLENGNGLIEITNNKKEKKDSLIIIKDSYANSFIPFLINDYHKIYIIDPLYFNSSISEFINEKNINNMLFLYNMNSLTTDVSILKIK